MNLRFALFAAAAMLATGPVPAQQGTAPATPAKPPPGAGVTPTPRNGTPKPLSDSEKVEKAADHVARMKVTMKSVLKRVEDARNEKDVVKLNCVNEKLTQVKGLLKVAEQAEIALNEAVARKDDSADTEFQKISMARAKVEGLRGEADQCIGQLAYVVDSETTVDVEQPENLPSLDVTRRRPPPRPEVTPPVVRAPPASRWY